MEHGLVFNLQKYCTHDGPGIRTTVFLKGCPLECWWCHNPESQDTEREVSVIESRCIRCGECLNACPQQAESGEGRAEGTLPGCTRCGACVAACPTEARQMIGRRMTVAEVMDEVLQDRVFYDDSGGGVTFSGGEPLAQPEFLEQLLEACRREAVHTAVDTCGYAPRETLLAVARRTDLFLYDLKIIDDRLHRRHTGVSNDRILENLLALGGVHDNIWIRVPIIPGFNDAPEHVDAWARFAAGVPGVRQVNVLSYHDLGSHKRRNGDASAADGPITPPSVEHLEAVADRLRSFGLKARTGG